MPTLDSQWLGLFNKLLAITLTIIGLLIITYPPTKLAVNIRHKRSLRVIGIAWITYQFLLAISLGTTHIISREALAWTLRILENGIYISIGIWGIVSIKEKITLR